MFEDMPHNLEAPHVLGMTTVLVRSEFNYDHPVQKTIRGWLEPPAHVHHMTDDLSVFLKGIGPLFGFGPHGRHLIEARPL